MFMEVYYEHYAENCRGDYAKERKSMPYMILERSPKRRVILKDMLERAGFKCVSWNYSYPGVLVNTELKRFAVITKPCRHSCVNGRNYSSEEFMKEVFIPLKRSMRSPSPR